MTVPIEEDRLYSLTSKERAVFALRETAVPFSAEVLQCLLGNELGRRVHEARVAWLEQHPVLDRDHPPENMSEVDVMRILGMARGTVSSHLARAKRKLKSIFGSAQVAKRPAKKTRSPISREAPEELPPRAVVRSLDPPEDEKVRILAAAAQADIRQGQPPEAPFSKRAWKEAMRKNTIKVGGPFKGCMACGTSESSAGRKVYTSGFEVYRAYKPRETGFTFWCYQCGAKDQECWENCQDELGKEPILVPREEKKLSRR